MQFALLGQTETDRGGETMSITDMDFYKFEQAGDSPVDNDWSYAAPRCRECGRAIDEDEGCLDEDCIAERDEREDRENEVFDSRS